jgi:glyoxylase-like metal-dependent hydrolase (beta-lactamase superfamily II)
VSFTVAEPLDGVVRVTFPLPFGIDHVHCYLLRGPDGWTLVDAGLGSANAGRSWESVLDGLDAPVARIVVTHFHPDHVGAATIAAEVAGAPVLEGVLDREQCLRAWGPDRDPRRFLDFMRRHGLPEGDVDAMRADGAALASLVAIGADPVPIGPGDRIDGWEVVHLPGHADGHLCLLRDGVLIAGDAILGSISPIVGLYPDSAADPLADYLDSLERIVALAPRIALCGHGGVVEDPPARARELVAHHADRLDQALATLGDEPRSGFDVSLDLFPALPTSAQRRFALSEACAHLEYLALRGTARRLADNGLVRYAAAE